MPATHASRPDDPSIRISATPNTGAASVLTPEAVRFIAAIERRFGPRRNQLLGLREDRQRRLNEGEQPGFRGETAELRDARWRVRTAPSDLQQRQVELSVPVMRDQLQRALDSHANCVIADFEDSLAPTWHSTLDGQRNLRDLIQSRSGQDLAACRTAQRPTLMIRPRGWHLQEQHLLVDGQSVSASLFDFALYLFHNGHSLVEQGSGPYLCLPKLESYIEAQLWADVFAYAEESLGLNHGAICCSVLIETLPAVFEMEEILYTLRDYAVGLNFERQDYLFSFIKRFQANPERVLPDCSQLTTGSGFLRACSDLLIQTSHRRGAHAIGGLSNPLPQGNGADSDDDAALRREKEQQASAGFDGTWVAYPGLVPVAREAFKKILAAPHQTNRQTQQREITEGDLLGMPQGEITLDGVNRHIRTGLRYLSAWLDGEGGVLIDHQLQDIADAEIARAQLWQWVHHPAGRLADGQEITFQLVESGLQQALQEIRREIGQEAYDAGQYRSAAELFGKVVASDTFVEFLTQPAYQKLA